MKSARIATAAAALAAAALAGAGSPVSPLPAASAGPSPGAAPAAVNLVWTHSAADLESLAASALPIRFAIGGKLFDQALVVKKAGGFKIEGNRLRFHVQGEIDGLEMPVVADPVLTLSFDPVKAVHTVALSSLPVTLGPLGQLDLSRLLGPWKIKPGQQYVIPVKGSAGIGMAVTIRRLELTPAGLRVESAVSYFTPPAEPEQPTARKSP